MENVFSYRDLDNVLGLLINKQKGGKMPSYDKFIEELRALYYEKDVSIIINKLVTDGMLKYVPRTHKDEDSLIFVTFEGMLKLQEGGYMGKINKENWSKRRDIYTSLAVGIGTLLAALFSILSYFNIH